MHPNADLVRRGFEAFAAGDIETLGKVLADDIVWVSETGGILKGRFEGQGDVFSMFARIPAETDGTFTQDLTGLYADDRVVVATLLTSAKRRGKSLDKAPGVIVFVVRDGKVLEGRIIAGDPELNDDFWAE